MSQRTCHVVVMSADGVTPKVCGGEIKECFSHGEWRAGPMDTFEFGICQSCNVMLGPQPREKKQIVVYEISDDYKPGSNKDQIFD